MSVHAPASPASQPRVRSAQADTFYRFTEVESSAADDDKMEVQVAFSSETPVLRRAGEAEAAMGIAAKGERYYECLSHEDGHADFSALNRTGAFLDEHKDREQLGSVRVARLSKDRIGRAVLRFDGASELSKTRYQQMKNRSRPHISFGYVHTAFLGDDGEQDGVPIKRIAFAADEISSVARPADPTVGVRRSASGQWACLGCGELFDSADLNENYECTQCRCASPTNMNANRSERPSLRNLSALFTRAESGKISYSNLSQWVATAARADARFNQDSKGAVCEYGVWVADIQVDEKGVQDGKDIDVYRAILQSADGKWFSVVFTFSDQSAQLGAARQVAPVTTYEPVSGGEARSADAGQSRTAPAVDSGALPNATTGATQSTTHDSNTMNRNIQLDPAPAGAAGGGTAIDEKAIRSDEAQKQRVAIQNEYSQRETELKKRNAEIHDIANDFVKTYGQRWSGKPGEVVICGEQIRSLELDACNAPHDRSASEVRMDFKRKVNDLVEKSYEPKNREEAAHLDSSVASRCSLGNLYRAAAKAAERGERVAAFMPKDGAEFEAHQEIRHRANEFPGGASTLAEGVLLPVNMPSKVHRGTPIPRMSRDAAAGDFATAGALIAPDYRFPTIELLRNLPALSRAGMTMITGLMGGGIVLPRQTGATTAQSIAENAALTAYDQVFDQVKLNPHRAGTKQNYSRLALLQSSDDFEGMVMADHMAQLALWIDYMGINGSGGNSQPTGLLNQVGVNAVSFGTSAATAYAKTISMETAIRSANIYEEISFITTSTSRGTLRVTPATLTGSTVVSGQSQAIWTRDGGAELCIGRPAVDSQQVPGNRLIAIVGRHLLLAQWGGIAVVLDTISQADKDQIRLCLNTYFDFALRHPQAVAISDGSVSTLS